MILAANIAPLASFCYIFYSRPENKNALSDRKNSGFYHILNEKERHRNVAQQKMDGRG